MLSICLSATTSRSICSISAFPCILEEQYRRFDLQRAFRAAGDEEAQPTDEHYLRAMSYYGTPSTGGEGIGIDRLVMPVTDSQSIRDVILFLLLRAEGEIGIAES